eukprot:5642454-Prorocentrum_lima.AAC.1
MPLVRGCSQQLATLSLIATCSIMQPTRYILLDVSVFASVVVLNDYLRCGRRNTECRGSGRATLLNIPRICLCLPRATSSGRSFITTIGTCTLLSFSS